MGLKLIFATQKNESGQDFQISRVYENKSNITHMDCSLLDNFSDPYNKMNFTKIVVNLTTFQPFTNLAPKMGQQSN